LIQLLSNNYVNILIVIYFCIWAGGNNAVGAPDEFEMLDLVHPLVWIWSEQQVESAVCTFSETFVIFVAPLLGHCP
jgi:hypothetical protein